MGRCIAPREAPAAALAMGRVEPRDGRRRIMEGERSALGCGHRVARRVRSRPMKAVVFGRRLVADRAFHPHAAVAATDDGLVPGWPSASGFGTSTGDGWPSGDGRLLLERAASVRLREPPSVPIFSPRGFVRARKLISRK